MNGSSGIAVGMATNIPPHNLREVIGAAVEVLDNPDATLDDLMRHVHGPDFPTKGIIMGRAGIRAAYATGRGKVTIRARTEFEEHGQNRVRIIVNELPYQVNKKMLIKNIAEQVKDKRLDDISDLRDESDRNGMRIVIELKRDANPQVALNKLFAQTQLQSTFSIINLALVDNQRQPKILSLRHILDEYLTFQEEVITRRTKYDLRKARERAHLLEGLLIAQDNIDEVIHIIRTSYDNAKENLMARFGLDDVQAQAILDMRLKALQGLDREKLQNEYDELEKKIAYLVSLLEDPEKLKGVLKDELLAIADKYGDDRKTEIQDVEDEIDMEDLIAEEECVFTLSHNGYIKRTPSLLLEPRAGVRPQGLPDPRGRAQRARHEHRQHPASRAGGEDLRDAPRQGPAGGRFHHVLHEERRHEAHVAARAAQCPQKRHPRARHPRGRRARTGAHDARQREAARRNARRHGHPVRRKRRPSDGPHGRRCARHPS